MVHVLKYCHDKNIIHRDLKPENIILNTTGDIKLIDFGFARVFGENSNLASTFAGTHNYMSPEIIQGKKYSYASDIWSLGVILYELITLKRPFDNRNSIELLKSICSEEPPNITGNYSHELLIILQAMLFKDPFSRIELTKIIKHPMLESFNLNTSTLNEQLTKLEQELTHQTNLTEKLENQITQLKAEHEKLKIYPTKNQQLRDQIEYYKRNNQALLKEIDQLANGYSQETIPSQTTQNLFEEGMLILRENLFDQTTQQQAFALFKEAADQLNDIEACWRVAACLFQSIGTNEDKKSAKIYAQKAMEGGSVDGTFWYGKCQDSPEDQFKYFKQTSDQNYPAGKYNFGICTYRGLGTRKSEWKGKKILQEVFESGDRYLTILYAMYLEQGWCGFTQDVQKSNELYRLAKTQPLSDSSVFFLFGLDPSLIKTKLISKK